MANPNPFEEAISRRFGRLRDDVGRQQTKATQQAQDQLKRQFARTGMVGSGAQIKQSQLANQSIAEQGQRAKEAIDVQELGERQRLAEVQGARDFARSERLGSQEFGSQQAQLAREFARQERLGSQKFQSVEADKQRGFSRQLFDIEQAFKNTQFNESVRQFQQQLDFSKDQFGMNRDELNRRFDLDKQAQEFNMNMANKVFNKKNLMESFLGSMKMDPNASNFGGFVGTGGFNPIVGAHRSGLEKAGISF